MQYCVHYEVPVYKFVKKLKLCTHFAPSEQSSHGIQALLLLLFTCMHIEKVNISNSIVFDQLKNRNSIEVMILMTRPTKLHKDLGVTITYLKWDF